MHTETTAQQRNFLCAKTEKSSQILSLGFSMARDCEAEKKKSRNFTFYVGRKPNPVDVAQL